LLAVELLTTLEIKDRTMADIELTTKQHNKIKRAVRALNDVRNELQKDNPNYLMQWYLEDGNNLNLMEGESHEGVAGVPQYDRVIDTYELKSASGGGW
jgi:hypothetical protein